MVNWFSRVLKPRRSPPAAESAVCSSAFWKGAQINDDDLISSRGYGIYDQMQKDAQVQACLNIKKLAVISRGWNVLPASDSQSDLEISRFVEYALQRMRKSIIEVLYNTLDAIAKGISIQEIVYQIFPDGPYDGMIGIYRIKSRNPQYFSFETDKYLNITGMISNVDSSRLDVSRFLIYTYQPVYESPYGRSDLRAAYKHYWSKDILTRFLNMYLERYGSPTVKGSYVRGTPKNSQEELLKVLDHIQQETAIVIPEDVKVELLESARGGEAGFLQALEWHDRQIAKAILGQTLMTDEGMRVGSFALAKVHLDVLRMCLLKLKRDLEETVMQEQLIKPLVDYNFAGVDKYPSFSLGTLDDRDFTSIAEAVCKLVNQKIVGTEEPWIREYLGIPMEKN